jgi:hypothetical protein
MLIFSGAAQVKLPSVRVNPLPRSIYYDWVTSEVRLSPHHWTEREHYSFAVGPSGDMISASRICRLPTDDSTITGVELDSRVELTSGTFTIVQTDDWTRTEAGVTCSEQIVAGKYYYKISDDGESMTVTRGSESQVQVWRRSGGLDMEPSFALMNPNAADERQRAFPKD